MKNLKIIYMCMYTSIYIYIYMYYTVFYPTRLEIEMRMFNLEIGGF